MSADLERLAALLASPTASALAEVKQELRALREEVELLRQALPSFLVSQEEAAEHIGVSLSTVKRCVKDRTLPVLHLRGCVRIDLTRVRGVSRADVAQEVREALRPIT